MASIRAEKMLEQCPHSKKTELKQFQCAECYDEAWAANARPLLKRINNLIDVVEEQNQLFRKLDEALAPPDLVQRDIEKVGGFISSLDLTETAEEIVARAVIALQTRRES